MQRLALALLLFVSVPLSAIAFDKTQPPGVENGDCFYDSSGHSSEVSVTGLMTGNQRVTITETTTHSDGTTTTATGTTEEATPSSGGGCWESDDFSVGDSTYKIDDGQLKRKNKNGDWITQSEGDCGDDDESPNSETPGDELGSLPMSGGTGQSFDWGASW